MAAQDQKIVEALKFYMDRGLIPRSMPTNAQIAKLAKTYSKMQASSPAGLSEVLSELNRAGLSPRDVLPQGTGKTAGRTPKFIKQMAEVLSDARTARASAVAPELLASMANESMLPATVAQDLIGKGTAPAAKFYAPALTTGTDVAVKAAEAAAASPFYASALTTGTDVAVKAAEAAAAAPAAAKKSVMQEIAGLFSKQGMKAAAKGAWKNKGKIGAGIAGAAILANYLLSDDEGSKDAKTPEKFSLPEDPQPTQPAALTDEVSVAQAAPARVAPAAPPTISELALALQGLTETARSLGREAQGGREAVRRAANAPAPKLRF